MWRLKLNTIQNFASGNDTGFLQPGSTNWTLTPVLQFVLRKYEAENFRNGGKTKMCIYKQVYFVFLRMNFSWNILPYAIFDTLETGKSQKVNLKKKKNWRAVNYCYSHLNSNLNYLTVS